MLRYFRHWGHRSSCIRCIGLQLISSFTLWGFWLYSFIPKRQDAAMEALHSFLWIGSWWLFHNEYWGCTDLKYSAASTGPWSPALVLWIIPKRGVNDHCNKIAHLCHKTTFSHNLSNSRCFCCKTHKIIHKLKKDITTVGRLVRWQWHGNWPGSESSWSWQLRISIFWKKVYLLFSSSAAVAISPA